VNRAIFLVELRLRSRNAALGALGLVLVALLVGALYPSLGDTIGKADVPSGIGNFIGGGDFATIAGWLRAEIMAVYGPLVFAGIAITSAAATTAGEEEDRIFALILAHPVSRTRLLLAKAVAVGLLLAVLAAALFGGLLASVAIAGGGIGAGDLAAVSVHLLFFGLAFGALALALGAGTGRRSVAGGGAAAVALAMFVINGVAPLLGSFSWIRYLTAFHFYEGDDPITRGVHPSGIAVLAALTAALVTAGAIAFERRDLRG
jgi:ABC-2 type transport system permease protein